MRTRPQFVSLIRGTGVGVAQRWFNQYHRHGGDWRAFSANGSTAGEIYDRLLALGHTPSRDDVAAVIGNKSWSYVTCDSCRDEVSEVVAIGDELELSKRSYCRTCITEAMELFSGEKDA